MPLREAEMREIQMEALKQPIGVVSSDRLWTIGDMAREYGVTLRALRFYEYKALIAPLRQGLARLYRAEDRRRLGLILTGKKLGFTLMQIREMLETGAPADPEAPGASFEQTLTPAQARSQLELLERQRAEIDDAIAQLRAAHGALSAAL